MKIAEITGQQNMRRAPLYHGTRLGSLLHMLELDRIGKEIERWRTISLTRDPRVAEYFSHSDSPHDTYGGILVLDQDKLSTRFKLMPSNDIDWVEQNPDHLGYRDEREELLLGGPIEPLSAYLLSINVNPEMLKQAMKNRAYVAHDEEINLYFRGRKRIVPQLIQQLMSNPLLNRWQHPVHFPAPTYFPPYRSPQREPLRRVPDEEV